MHGATAAGQAFARSVEEWREAIKRWLDIATLSFPSGRTADEIVLDDAAGLAWVVNLGCIDLNPHPVRADDLDHPDELRVDLDPVPGVPWSQIRDVAMVAREALEAVGLVGWPKTSGSRGIHINVRIEPRWTYPEVRRAALALARDVERRAPSIATSKWWKEERHGVFLDYNQNAKDRTVASVYSVRPTPDARVSMPLAWDDVPTVEAEAFTLATVPTLFASAAIRAPASTRRSAPLRRCSSCRPATRRRASAMRRGHRPIASNPASRRGCSPPSSAGPMPITTRRRPRPSARSPGPDWSDVGRAPVPPRPAVGSRPSR